MNNRRRIRFLSIAILAFLVLGTLRCVDIWIQPPRSQANLEALDRVEIRSYEFIDAGGLKTEYGIYVPTTYQVGNPTPLLIALHGHGSGVLYMLEYNNLVELAESYGFIVATPLGFSERGWFGSKPPHGFQVSTDNRKFDAEETNHLSELDVINVLAKVREEFSVDNDRVYLIGQSMGGGGTWYLASKYPDLWAAIAPLSPVTGEDPEILEKLSHIPVMLVAGDRDIEMDIRTTRLWVDKMAELNMDYEYLEISGGTHSAAGRANIDKVFRYLNEQSKQ